MALDGMAAWDGGADDPRDVLVSPSGVLRVAVPLALAAVLVGGPVEGWGWGAHVHPFSNPPHQPTRLDPWPHLTLLHV